MSISDMLLEAAYRGDKAARTVVSELLGTVKVGQISDEQAQVIAKVVRPARASQKPPTDSKEV